MPDEIRKGVKRRGVTRNAEGNITMNVLRKRHRLLRYEGKVKRSFKKWVKDEFDGRDDLKKCCIGLAQRLACRAA